MPSELPPALFLALACAVAIASLIPATGWFLLKDLHTPATRAWFAAMGAYAASAVVFMTQVAAGLPGLPYGLAFLAVALATQALRLDSGRRPASVRLIVLGAAGYALIIAGIESAAGATTTARFIHLAVVTGFEIWIMRMALGLRRRTGSRGMLVMVFGLVWIVGVNLLRMINILARGETLRLADLTPMGNLVFLSVFLPVAIFGLGYWGFVFEKSNLERLRAHEAATRAHEAQRVSEAFSARLQELIQQRDQMIMALSRFQTLGNLAVFNAGIVHEVSQPLQGLLSCIETLALDAASHDHDPARLAKDLEKARTMALEAARTVQALRQLSTAAPPDPVRVVALEPVLRVLPVIESEARQRGVEFRFQQEVPATGAAIRVHPTLLERVILNLVANALEAMERAAWQDRPRRLEIRCELQAARASRPADFVMTVVDTGPGLSSAKADPRDALHPSSKPGGMGVGLLWVRVLMERWGGQVEVANRPISEGTGVCAQFRLPLVDPA